MNTEHGWIVRYGLLLLLVSGLGIWGWQQFKQHNAEWMPVRHVRVEGTFQYLTREEVTRALMPLVETGFYQLDLQAIKQTLQHLPWTDLVSVQRVWPDAVDIQITEQQPVARWWDRSLINDRGELFSPDNIQAFADLPEIAGPAGQHAQLLRQMKQLRKMLADKGMLLQRFYVNERRAWQVRLVTGLELKLGRLSPIAQLQRFLSTVGVLGNRLIELMVIVDLRYPNGFAVTWKSDDWKNIVEEKNAFNRLGKK